MAKKKLKAKTPKRRTPKALSWVSKKGYIICPECGQQFKAGKPHYMFCEAMTCEECGTTIGEVLEPGSDGRRLCQSCDHECRA